MDINKLKESAEEYAAENGLVVISLKCSSSNVIDIFLDSVEGVSIDKCIELNRLIESSFDRDVEDYELTVSSASVSDPFSHPIHYQKNIGREIEFFTHTSHKYSGVLESFDQDGFEVSYSEKVAEEGKKRKVLKEFTKKFPYSEVREVRLVFKF